MRKKTFIFVPILLFIALYVINAFVFGSTNFGYGGYPNNQCSRPYSRDNQYANQRYRDCIVNYVEAADNDIERVIEARNDAIDEYNDWATSLF